MLVRATASLRLLEEALEEQGLPTYVVGGRGYWSQEQVRDGLAWLRVLANPHDEEALLTVLSSPFHGARTDELVTLDRSRAGPAAACGPRSRRRGTPIANLLAAERDRAERAPLEVLLERAIVATGYDLAILARPGGDRRLANLRKLMRLAGEYERAEGRDLRGFLADAAARDLAEAREGEAALESEGLDAVRLMTIHRAKGLEFPVVCVADLGRQSGARRSPLLVDADRNAGLRLAPLGGGDTIPTTAWERLAGDRDRGRRRGGAAAVLRRHDPRPRAADPLRRHRHGEVARAPPRRPADRLDRPRASPAKRPRARRAVDAQLGRAPRARRDHDQHAGDAARGGTALTPARPRRRDHRAARVPAFVPPQPTRARPAPQRLSYSQLSATGSVATASTSSACSACRDVTPPPLPDGEEVDRHRRPHARVDRARRTRDTTRLAAARRPRADRRGDRGHPPPDRGVRGVPACSPDRHRAQGHPRGRASRSRSSPTAPARSSAASST